MKKVITGIVAAATLLSAAPAFAIDIGFGPRATSRPFNSEVQRADFWR